MSEEAMKEEKKNLPTTKASSNKMTLEEYKAKYSKPQNVKAASFFLVMFAGAIGIIIFTCLLLAVLRIYDMNEIAGYVSIAPAVLVFILFYVVPLVKINKLPSFQTVVDSRNAKQAKAHNKKVRASLADSIISFASETDNIGWYDENRVGKLALARQTNDNEALKNALSEIFDTDVRKTARGMITKTALKVGAFTALSQDDKLDSAIISLYGLNLVKEIFYLYGFRPSEARMARIFANIVSNALIAYGASASTTTIVHGLSESLGSKLGVLGGIISTVVGSASQGLVNGILIVILGMKTKHYLNLEYHMQDVLDGVLLDEEDEEEILQEVKNGIGQAIKDNKKKEEK